MLLQDFVNKVSKNKNSEDILVHGYFHLSSKFISKSSSLSRDVKVAFNVRLSVSRGTQTSLINKLGFFSCNPLLRNKTIHNTGSRNGK